MSFALLTARGAHYHALSLDGFAPRSCRRFGP